MKPKMSEGQSKFLKNLSGLVREKGSENANLDCMECGVKIFLKGPALTSMNVFVYPDAPFYTTKALCFNCMNKALKEHGGKTVTSPLN